MTSNSHFFAFTNRSENEVDILTLKKLYFANVAPFPSQLSPNLAQTWGPKTPQKPIEIDLKTLLLSYAILEASWRRLGLEKKTNINLS